MRAHRMLMPALLLASGLLSTAVAQAGELYGQLGFPGFGLGYAHPVSERISLRGDFMTLGSRSDEQTEDGITYQGQLKAHRLGLFADWFVFGGSFRLTGGVASSRYQLDLDASGAGRQLDVGGTTYTLGADDGLNVRVKFPTTMPYLGLGWGHQAAQGLRFSVDLGALIGKAKVSATGRGTQLGSASAQASIDRETAELKESVGKASFIPQITFGLGYSF